MMMINLISVLTIDDHVVHDHTRINDPQHLSYRPLESRVTKDGKFSLEHTKILCEILSITLMALENQDLFYVKGSWFVFTNVDHFSKMLSAR
jgi:hypothetical protein